MGSRFQRGLEDLCHEYYLLLVRADFMRLRETLVQTPAG